MRWLPRTIFLATAFTIAAPFESGHARPKKTAADNALAVRVPDANPRAIELGLRAFAGAKKRGETARNLLTLIDYSRASTEKRLWVIDLEHGTVLFHELVAHGKNSGDNFATTFSNRAGSLASSLGTFVTGETYDGKHGYSLKLRGLDRGLNDRAEDRSIVIHGADYVSDAFIEKQGRLGRSWGCPALRPEISAKVIDAIKDGTVVFAYYPDRELLAQFPADR